LAIVSDAGSVSPAIGDTDSLARIEKFLWILLLLLTPISSSPLLPLGAGTQVRPLALIPMGLLFGLVAIRMMFLGQRPNLQGDRGCFALLVCFTAYVLISGLMLVAFLPDKLFKGQTPLDSLLRALATVGIGIGFYAVCRLHIRSVGDARLTQRYLFIGMSASIALAVLQIFAIIVGGGTLRTVQDITNVFAVHYLDFINRAQGMTYEPSWLATQITLLLLPWLVARSVSGQDFVGARTRKRVSVAVIGGFLLVLVGLLCAGSRFGIASAFGILVLC